MLGHLMEWFYSGLGGIKQESNSTAFQQIIIKPEPVGNVTQTSVSYLSPYGLIKNQWAKTDKEFIMLTQIPANTSAIIYLPAKEGAIITEGGEGLKKWGYVKLLRYENGKALIKAGSGSYSFIVKNI
jgi:alpha-L-rhamnosidase